MRRPPCIVFVVFFVSASSAHGAKPPRTHQPTKPSLLAPSLNRLLRNLADNDPSKADYYFRMAEHFRANSLQYNFQARALDERIFSASDFHATSP